MVNSTTVTLHNIHKDNASNAVLCGADHNFRLILQVQPAKGEVPLVDSTGCWRLETSGCPIYVDFDY